MCAQPQRTHQSEQLKKNMYVCTGKTETILQKHLGSILAGAGRFYKEIKSQERRQNHPAYAVLQVLRISMATKAQLIIQKAPNLDTKHMKLKIPSGIWVF